MISKSCCNMLGLSHMPRLSIIFETFIRSEICAYLYILVHFYLQRFGTIFTGNIACSPANDTLHVATSRHALGQEYHHVMMKSQALQVLVLIQVSLLHLSSQGMELWVSPFGVRFQFGEKCGWNDASWNSWNIVGILGVTANIHPNT